MISDEGVRVACYPFPPPAHRSFCIFEYRVFRPSRFSIVDGRSRSTRSASASGMELAREIGVPSPTSIVPVPDSGVPAALGYRPREAGVPFELGIIRNHYVGRTFIQPTHAIRHMGVKLKHSANRAIIEGKRVVLVDDSIVRGTTSMKIVEMMRDAGAGGAYAHRLARRPPNSCFYGVDTPESARSCWPRRR